MQRELTGHNVFAIEGDDYEETLEELIEFMRDEDTVLSVDYSNFYDEDHLVHTFRVVV